MRGDGWDISKGRWTRTFSPLSARNHTMGPHYNQLVTQITNKTQMSR